jgi:hypothetical protein
MALTFQDFFDWDELNYRDFQYYLVDIAASSKYPELIGREALLEVSTVRVLAFAGPLTEQVVEVALSPDKEMRAVDRE